jgi:hypothetical protein
MKLRFPNDEFWTISFTVGAYDCLLLEATGSPARRAHIYSTLKEEVTALRG